jgi:tRNA (cmo5U34)-methyltransferase
MSYYILKIFPHAKVTLIDLSAEMLLQAENRLTNYSGRIEIIKGNYVNYSYGKKYDVIISALSIHHIDDDEKRSLFDKIYQSLKPDGQFINADQVLGNNEQIEKAYRVNWLQEVNKRGVSEEELERALTRMKEDKMSTLDSQLEWLKDSGFRNINCWFKDYSFVVYAGEK